MCGANGGDYVPLVESSTDGAHVQYNQILPSSCGQMILNADFTNTVRVHRILLSLGFNVG
jgi:hypothetical protein